MSHTARINNVLSHLAPQQQLQSNLTSSPAPVFQYTRNPDGLLTNEQREFYEKNGFLLIRGVFTQEEIDVWTKRFVDIANGNVERVPTMTMMRDVAIAKKKEMGEKAITKLQDWQDDEVLFSYCNHPKITPWVKAIIGSSFKSVHTMLINKPPDVGLGSSRHPPHQDLWYFPFRPAEKICASWTAMQKIDRENGCLFVKPGSHTGNLLKHEYPSDGVVNKAYHGIQNLTEEDGKQMFHVEMEVGDTIFFHPILIHGSGRNNSSRYRKAISTHYAATDCIYTEMEGTIQEELAKEIEQMASRKGVQLSFNDVWRAKSRLIMGKEDTL